jgi:hypothetical protein
MTSRVTGAVLRDDTIQRLGGNGDNWHATWAADGSLYVAMCDGAGFPGMRPRRYNSRLIRVDGHPETEVSFHDVPEYPDLSMDIRSSLFEPPLPARYYGFGTLSVDGTIYQYCDMQNVPTIEENLRNNSLKFVGAKLIYSPDGGKTWHNQDGSTPVYWEDWDERSTANSVFFHEPDNSFALHSILQMGRDYELNTDGYIYVYAPNGDREGTMNELVMFRVPKGEILDRSAYEYFVAVDDAGGASWSSDIAARGVVHTFPSGWVNTGIHPDAWQPFVTYNPGLGIYLMANWATGPSPEGMWFGKPSYLGLYQAATPWGPWEQFSEGTAWRPGGDENARCYQPVIVPNWISEDGKSFWMIWTDFQNDAERAAAGRAAIEQDPDQSDEDYARNSTAGMPYYSFNVQLVELTTDPE